MIDNKDIKSISEAYLGMFSESKQRPIKFSGKTFTDYKVFNSDKEANKFLEKNDDYGVIGEKGGKVYVAKKSDLGESTISESLSQKALESRLENGNFQLVTARNVDLSNEMFGIQANFNFATFSKSNFKNSDFRSSKGRDAVFTECNFEGAKFTGSKFPNGNFTKSNFKNADLSSGYFENALFGLADFSGADLGGVNFKNAYLKGANFNGADISRAILDGAEGANLTGAKIDKSTKLSNMRESKFRESGESKEDSIVNEHLDEANDMEGKDYTFVATVRGMSNARKKASEYSNAQIVQIDNDFYGVIVPAK